MSLILLPDQMPDTSGERRPGDTAPGRFYLISYDICDDRRRLKLARALKGFGERVQRSVFECILTETQYHELRRRVDKLIDTKEDSIRYYNLGTVKLADVEVCGIGTVSSVPPLYIV
jgi:CRISPR-associated protein Cas2